MTLEKDINHIMPFCNKYIHVCDCKLGILWSPLKNKTIAKFGHPLSKSWLGPWYRYKDKHSADYLQSSSNCYKCCQWNWITPPVQPRCIEKCQWYMYWISLLHATSLAIAAIYWLSSPAVKSAFIMFAINTDTNSARYTWILTYLYTSVWWLSIYKHSINSSIIFLPFFKILIQGSFLI